MRNGLIFLGILALVALAAWFDFSSIQPIQEGLDLKGGARITLEVDRDQIKAKHLNVAINSDTMEQVRQIMENRVNGFGLSGATVQVKGEDQILVLLPGVTDPEEATQRLEKVAQLEFRWLKDVQSEKNPMARYRMNTIPGASGTEEQYTFFDTATNKPVTEQFVLDKAELIMTGKDLMPESKQAMDPGHGPVVEFVLRPDGTRTFANFTSNHKGDILAIVLDGHIISAPRINEPITEGKGEIYGNFKITEARDLAQLLNSGSLPVPMRMVEMQQVGATLGQEAIHRSIYAGVGGLALVLIFMLAYYLLPGVLANIALLFYATITFAIFKAANVVMDLPGITGFILSVGMAVDANILIFERLREELRAGKTLHAAIDAGFNRAFTSIFDSNMTTWIVCAVLYTLGAPMIKGFALTLAIGVAVSMFTAITVTRTMLHLVVNFPWARSEKAFGLGVSWLSNRFGEGRWLDVIGRRAIYFSLDGVMLAAAIVFLAMGGLKPGIDFRGGSEVQAVFRQPVPRDQIQSTLGDTGLKPKDYTLTNGWANLYHTDVTVTLNGELSTNDQPALRQRLETIRGFDPSAYHETSAADKKSTTATAVYWTANGPLTEATVKQALNDAKLTGTSGLPLAKLPASTVKAVNPEPGGKPQHLQLWIVNAIRITPEQSRAVKAKLHGVGGGFIVPAYSQQTIGPSVAKEVTSKAFLSVIVASLLIILYLAFRFAIGGFLNGLKFGVCAVIALIHDVLTITGLFALLGYMRGWQIDSMFVTAALTIIGFSVHDTIVVYDRIRENLHNRLRGETFEGVANRSITQTFDRSINTSFTVVLVLVSLAVFGGFSIKQFTVALLGGIIVGTYSSIFVASPLVVLLERWLNPAGAGAATTGRTQAGPGRRGPGRGPTGDVSLRPPPTRTPGGAAAPTPEGTRPAPAAGAQPNGKGAPGETPRPAPRPAAPTGPATIKPKRKRRS